MSTPILLTLAVATVALLYTVAGPILMFVQPYLRPRTVRCPTQRVDAEVRINALGAALSRAYSAPHLTAKRCTLLGPGKRCDSACLKGAA
ncbi:MAG: hypothetical protein HY423_01810 [Candidatus Lambdaproteobacteria bacterium]|nr:hypothetical protein [Candidatus Lambdaproteobacteria bacterium]